MAYVIGVGLAVLVFVAMPLRYWADFRGVSAVVGPVHGALYIVYVLAALDLARRHHLGFLWVLAMVSAGLLPLLAFFIERRVTQRVETHSNL